MVRKNKKEMIRVLGDKDLRVVSGASAEDTLMKLHYDAVDRGDKLAAAFFYGAVKGYNS